jgi:hypothetical protein
VEKLESLYTNHALTTKTKNEKKKKTLANKFQKHTNYEKKMREKWDRHLTPFKTLSIFLFVKQFFLENVYSIASVENRKQSLKKKSKNEISLLSGNSTSVYIHFPQITESRFLKRYFYIRSHSSII